MTIEKYMGKVTPLVHNYRADPDYKPDVLLDKVKEVLGIRFDSKLAEVSGTSHAVLSRVRSKRIDISDEILLRFHDISGMEIGELKALANIKQTAGLKCQE